MNKHRDKYFSQWKIIYFDAFAGSGSDNNKNTEEIDHNLLKELDITVEEQSIYKGAAERVLSIEQRGFDYYYFIDKNKKASGDLKTKLQKFAEKGELKFLFADANDEIKKLAAAMMKNKNLKALILLDPFGMQVNWESIEKLQNTGTDLWVLVPTGMIINRLLDRKGELKYANKLKSFFGLTEEEIKNHFYQKDKQLALFDEETKILKQDQSIKKIAELYIKRLKTIFNEVIDHPLELRNTKNVPIYHFAFASNNKTAKKIAKDIIGKY